MTRFFSILLFIIFFFLLFLFINELSNKNRKERNDFSLRGKLTIGVIIGKGMGNPRTLSYSYLVNDIQLQGGDPRFYMDPNGSDIFNDKEKSKPGKKFLVIYNAYNPKKSIIRLDCPITDSADFKRYELLFEQIRKE